MKLRFNVKGNERKKLVKEIVDIRNSKSKYLGVPSCSYQVDYFTIDRDGTVECDDSADIEGIESLVNELKNRGFITNDEISKDDDKVTPLLISIPIDNVNVSNLNHLLEIKGDLIKKALGISDIGIDITDDEVCFPWFDSSIDTESIQVYTRFISKLCEMSIEQNRINDSKKKPENEKYAFRCFLLRLGYIGDEYKTDRKILLQYLEGSSAFRIGAKKEVSTNAITQ